MKICLFKLILRKLLGSFIKSNWICIKHLLKYILYYISIYLRSIEMVAIHGKCYIRYNTIQKMQSHSYHKFVETHTKYTVRESSK